MLCALSPTILEPPRKQTVQSDSLDTQVQVSELAVLVQGADVIKTSRINEFNLGLFSCAHENQGGRAPRVQHLVAQGIAGVIEDAQNLYWTSKWCKAHQFSDHLLVEVTIRDALIPKVALNRALGFVIIRLIAR